MNWTPIITNCCCASIFYFEFVMIKMSKTIQLSWVIDYFDPHFSGNGKSFNQDQDLWFSNLPCSFIIWSSPSCALFKSWTSSEGSERDVKTWPNSADGATHISQRMAGFVQEPAQIRWQRKKLCNSSNFSSFPIGRLPCYSFANARRVISDWLV